MTPIKKREMRWEPVSVVATSVAVVSVGLSVTSTVALWGEQGSDPDPAVLKGAGGSELSPNHEAEIAMLLLAVASMLHHALARYKYLVFVTVACASSWVTAVSLTTYGDRTYDGRLTHDQLVGVGYSNASLLTGYLLTRLMWRLKEHRMGLLARLERGVCKADLEMAVPGTRPFRIQAKPPRRPPSRPVNAPPLV